jgi:hypothetical protein
MKKGETQQWCLQRNARDSRYIQQEGVVNGQSIYHCERKGVEISKTHKKYNDTQIIYKLEHDAPHSIYIVYSTKRLISIPETMAS